MEFSSPCINRYYYFFCTHTHTQHTTQHTHQSNLNEKKRGYEDSRGSILIYIMGLTRKKESEKNGCMHTTVYRDFFFIILIEVQ